MARHLTRSARRVLEALAAEPRSLLVVRLVADLSGAPPIRGTSAPLRYMRMKMQVLQLF